MLEARRYSFFIFLKVDSEPQAQRDSTVNPYFAVAGEITVRAEW